MISPDTAFIRWFDNLPDDIKQNLAHVFKVSTAEDISQMTQSGESSLKLFRFWFLKDDFFIRKTAKLFMVRSLFDMMIMNKELFMDDSIFLQHKDNTKNLLKISDAYWKKTSDSWQRLRCTNLSDTHMNLWVKTVLRRR
jgi:hypothetical protein